MISTPREAHTLCLAVQSSALSSARCRGANPPPHAGASENIGSISFTPPLVVSRQFQAPVSAGPFSERIAVCSEKGASYIRPSLLLLGFPPHPEAGFFLNIPGCRFGFLRKGRKAYQYGNPPRIDTARAFGAQSVNNMDTPRHG